MSNVIKKMSLKDIFSTPALDYYIEPENCRFFIRKPADYEQVANLVNSSKTDAMFKSASFFQKDIQEGPLGEHYLFKTSDNSVTALLAEGMKSQYVELSDKISTEKMLLFYAAITKDFLQDIDRVRSNKVTVLDNFNRSEMCYANGDIISIASNAIYFSRDGRRDYINSSELQEVEDKMVEAILIANNQINSSNKKVNFSVVGNYKPTGQNPTIKRISFSTKELQEYAQSTRLIKKLSIHKLGDVLDKKLISKNVIFKMIAKGEVDKRLAIQLMADGAFTQEDVLSKVFKLPRMNDLLSSKDVNYGDKLLLYSAGKISVDLLEKSVKQYQEENVDLTETFEEISQYYENDITKISELLTHNVLDYNNSQRFLNLLQEEGKITSEQKNYLEGVMSDFKTNELLNNTENEVISISSNGGNTYQKYRPGLTIDPEERIKYFKSLGSVKKVKVRGEHFIKDSEDNVGKKNSLDGYELFVIPEKRVALLEKLYETTRNEKGQMEYKKNKDGKLIPALGNATYVIPIEMAAEFTKKKNKKELIESPEVRRASHSMEWVSNLESKITALMRSRNIEIEFNGGNTQVWAEKIRNNYLENKKKRELDVK